MGRARQPGSANRQPAEIRYSAVFPKKNIIGARIKIESNEIAGRFALNGKFFSGCDFGVKLLSDSLRDLALDCEHVVQIAIVLFDPDVGIGPRVDQLRVQMKMRAGPADAALQNVRYPQLVTDLAHIPFAAVIHDTRPADDFQAGNLRQLGQNVVLNTVGKGCVLFLLAQIFKWRTAIPFVSGCRINSLFQTIHPAAAAKATTACRKQRAGWIASHPFPSSRENSSVPRLNRFVL